MKTYQLINGDKEAGEDVIAIRCLLCRHTSYSPEDISHLYCGNCHRWHEVDPWTDLGPCCACEGKSGLIARNVMMLHRRGTTPGTGWGCFTCGLPPDGASAVICDACIDQENEILYAIDGTAADKKRIPIDQLPEGDFDHDTSKHPEFSVLN